jgi:lipopolysaccharide transport system permease protein
MLGHARALFGAIWHYRYFVGASVAREFRARYARSGLGALWVVFPALVQITIFTLVFANLMRPSLAGMEGDRFAYSVYLCAGVISWSLFAELLTRMCNVFIEHAQVIRKTSVPRVTFPLICMSSALLNFLVLIVLFLVFLGLVGKLPGWEILHLLPVLAVLLMLAGSLGLLLGTLNVFVRDIGHLLGVVIQFAFWLTPIVYVPSILPEAIQGVLQFNPMWPIVSGFQSVFVWQRAPDWSALMQVSAFSLMLAVLAVLAFHRMAPDLADEL